MDSTIILTKVLEQGALIGLCGLIIWQLLKMFKEKETQLKELIDKHTIEIKALIDKHTEELKDLNLKKQEELKDFQKVLREQDSENRDTIQKLIITLEGLKAIIAEKL